MTRHFSPDFFSANRMRLIERLRGGIVALSAYTELQASNDVEHPFVQEANFWYLTGIAYPNWQLIIDGKRAKSWLVMPEYTPEQIIFGGCLSAEEAQAIGGVTAVVDRAEAQSLLRQLARSHSLVYTCDPPAHDHFSFTLNPAPREFRQQLERTFTTVQNCRPELEMLRSSKQPAEITAIKTAIALTIDGFTRVKKNIQTYTYEYQVEADFTHHFRFSGADGHAYPPTIAAGGRACTLHYRQNAERLKKRSLLLMDVGARYENYAADITRTYAIGEPSKRMRAVHEAVWAAQQDIIALCQPGVSLKNYRQQADAIMEATLVDLQLIRAGDVDGFYRYFPHAIGHGLGIDVHDSMGTHQTFQPGMVITVEPGIYIAKEAIGIRIEDDIYISDSGPVNLSAKLSTQMM